MMRLLLRLLAPLLGLALAAGGAVLAVEVAWAWLRPDGGRLLVPWRGWLATAGGLTWADTAVRLTAAAVLAGGLVLLLVALLAGRRELPFTDPAPDVTVTTSPGALARVVGQRVRSADGVHTATVTASRRAVRVRAVGRPADRGQRTDEVRRLVQALPLRRTPRVRVTVQEPKEAR